MSTSQCPACGEDSISTKQRLKASHWMDIYCDKCGARMSMQPIPLVLLQFIIVWDIYFFGFMAFYEQSILYAVAMIVGWAILEFFAFYIPLVKLKPKSQPKKT